MHEYNERERKQIEHALEYSCKFSKAGAPGHAQFLLIAKLWQDREEFEARLAYDGRRSNFPEH
jgi:hypothetical protein